MTDRVLRVGIKVRENTNRVAIKVSEGNGGSGRLPAYEGNYQVTPRKQEIVLPTRNKSMTDDVTVFQIPYASVPNLSGGFTVTIGIE